MKSLVDTSDQYTDEQMYIMNGKSDLLNPKVYGVEPNFLRSIASELFFLEEENSKYKYDKLSSGQSDVVKKFNELFKEDNSSVKFDEK